MYFCEPRRGANGATLYQVLQYLYGFVLVQDHIAKRFFPWLRERLFADRAAVSLRAVAVLAELLSWYVAGFAVHFAVLSLQRNNIKQGKQCQAQSRQRCVALGGDLVYSRGRVSDIRSVDGRFVDMFVDTRFLKSVSFIYADRTAANGRMERVPIGTVFFVQKSLDSSDEKATSNRSNFKVTSYLDYAVTARHVLDQWEDKDGQPLYIRLNTTRGRFEDLPTTRADWKDHIDSHDTDVSVCSMPNLICAPYESVADIARIPFTMLATRSYVTENPIYVGYDLFIYGLFINHPGEVRVQPVARFGNLSMIPNEKVEAELRHPSGQLHRDSYRVAIEAYLIEARSMGGLSGSPVLFYFPPLHPFVGAGTDEFDNYVGQGRVPTLLGLVQGQYEWDRNPPVINAGISIVVPAWKIREAILQPELARHRARLLNDKPEPLMQPRG
jgi:hypothetical protein